MNKSNIWDIDVYVRFQKILQEKKSLSFSGIQFLCF